MHAVNWFERNNLLSNMAVHNLHPVTVLPSKNTHGNMGQLDLVNTNRDTTK